MYLKKTFWHCSVCSVKDEATREFPPAAMALLVESSNALEDFVALPEAPELSPMSRRFLLAEEGNREKAIARFRRTSAWRADNSVEGILFSPQPNFLLLKRIYSANFHLSDKNGNIVLYDKPGSIDWPQLEKAQLGVDDLVRHYVYAMEFLWAHLAPRQTDKLTIVIDLDGMRLADVRGNAASFMKASISTLSRHYPLRSNRIFVVNAPSSFSAVFSCIKPLLCERTRNKIQVVPSGAVAKTLLEVIESANLPPAYGGTCVLALGSSAYERQLRDYVASVLEKSAGAAAAATAAAASSSGVGAAACQVPSALAAIVSPQVPYKSASAAGGG